MTTMDDQELASLRQAFAAHLEQTDPAPCPAPETIWDAVHGKLPADGVRESVQHVATCATCAEEWRLARTLRTLSEQQEQTAAAPLAAPLPFTPRQRQRGQWRQWRNWGLAAAAALALAVVGVQWFQKPPEYRGERAAVHSQVADGKALPREHFLLKWSVPTPAGATYCIQVSTEDLRVVANAEGLKAPEYQVPARALAGLSSGAKLFWKVDADLPSGSHLTSPTFVTAVQ
ncbi:MAG TPA: hypothetical protein VH988_19810 [Thermoanaerobaculia bacterium]|nr:hypothetical protein [Thermoanaerobaculia bacterium]